VSSVDDFFDEPHFGETIRNFCSGATPSLIFTLRGKRVEVLRQPTQDMRGSRCVYFLRSQPDSVTPLSTNSIGKEVVTGILDDDLLPMLRLLLEQVYQPAIGEDEESAAAPKKETQEFMGAIESFVHSIDEAGVCVQHGIVLNISSQLSEWCEEQLDANLGPRTLAQRNAGMVPSVRTTLISWCQLIRSHVESTEQDESLQDGGPMSELQHWKGRMATCEALMEQVSRELYRPMLQLLSQSEPAIVTDLSNLTVRLSDACAEAKDNVKFLYTLEKFTTPLYHGSPIDGAESMPGLLNAIQIMYNISRFFNTQQSIQQLLVKVNQQMVHCCRRYVLSGEACVFKLDPDTARASIDQCASFNELYHQQYYHVKGKLLQHPMQKQWDFDEKILFGKLDNFCHQLQDIKDILDFVLRYDTLCAAAFANFQPVAKCFREFRQYLDAHSNASLHLSAADFNIYIADVHTRVAELDDRLLQYIQTEFKKISGTTEMLTVLRQLESSFAIHAPPQAVQDVLNSKFHMVLKHYNDDLSYIEALYTDLHRDPPLPRDFPQVAG